MKKVLFVYNPRSGDKTIVNNLDYIIDRFQKKDFEIYLYRIDKTKRFERVFTNLKLHESEYSKIIVAGGDGTVNQVVDNIIKNDINVPLGIFPIGTCNDFANQCGFDSNIKKQIDTVLQDEFMEVDVGIINGKSFINVASFGSLVSTGQKVNDSAKTVLGPWAYYFKALEELVDMKPINVTIKTDKEEINEEIFFMLIMNGKSAGGFSKIANNASISDGILDVVILKKCPFTEYPKVWLDILAGNHHKNKNIIYTKAKRLNIECKQNVIVDIDGERGPDFPLDITVCKHKIKLLCGNVKE